MIERRWPERSEACPGGTGFFTRTIAKKRGMTYDPLLGPLDLVVL